jgi:hypothetical protein
MARALRDKKNENIFVSQNRGMEVVGIPFDCEQLPDRSDPHRFRGKEMQARESPFDHRVAPSKVQLPGTDKISIPVAMPTSQ